MSHDDVTMPVWQEKHLRAATRAAGVALWSWNVDTDAITMDEAAYDLWGVSKNERKITFEILSKNIHPADLERVRSCRAGCEAWLRVDRYGRALKRSSRGAAVKVQF